MIDDQKKPPSPVLAGVSPFERSASDLKVIQESDADKDTLKLMEAHGAEVGEITPEKEKKLVRKLWFHVVLLMIVINLMLFIDKTTLGQAALLGILDLSGVNDVTYNNLNTIFYTGYFVGQIPGHFLIQRLPFRIYVSGTVFLWALIVFLHCAATSYGGLIPARFFLGVVESPMVPAMELTMTMFFTPTELHTVQPLFWISCVGSIIPAGALAYALLWSQSSIAPWMLFMITTGGLSLLLSILCWFVYPSNPATAVFLSAEEKVHCIRRVQDATKSAIEQKTFKKYQFVEALKDPISWLFATAAFCLMLANNLAFQLSLLYLDLGIDNLDSTLIWTAAGGFAVVVAIVASILIRWFPNLSAYWGLLWVLPAIAGSIGMVALPWSETYPLLACLLLATNTFGMTYIIMLGWTSSSCSGHTEKVTRNVLFMATYDISNIISPQMWVSGGPRYYGTWIAQRIVSFVITPACLFAVRWILVRRNKKRRAWIAEQAALGNHGEGYVEEVNEAGETVKVKVDVSLLDPTDLENKFFIYPL